MKKWVAIVIVGLIVLGLALVLGGGMYKTVNIGHGAVYLVNRYTGKTCLVLRENVPLLGQRVSYAPRRLEGVDLAIALAKNSYGQLGNDYDSNHVWLIHYLRDAELSGSVNVKGWSSQNPFKEKYTGKNLYLVGFTYTINTGYEEKLLSLANEILREYRLSQDDSNFYRRWADWGGKELAFLDEGIKWLALAKKDNEIGWFWEVETVERTRVPIVSEETFKERYGLQPVLPEIKKIAEKRLSSSDYAEFKKAMRRFDNWLDTWGE